jgi:hypothetical protein
MTIKNWKFVFLMLLLTHLKITVASENIQIERYEKWDHPVLSVFKKYNVSLYKVSYSKNGNCPTFYANFYNNPSSPSSYNFYNKFYEEILKANSSFPYALVDKQDNLKINVGWSDKNRKKMVFDTDKASSPSLCKDPRHITKDIIIAERIIVTNGVSNGFSDKEIWIEDAVDTITNKDNIMFYAARIVVINPTKKEYNVRMTCIDSKNNIVFNGSIKMLRSKIYSYVDKDSIAFITQHLGLNPKQGAMVKGQRTPLVGNNDYYIKLYVENKLIGITKFYYKIDK